MSVSGPRIEITVSPKGQTKTEVFGVTGGMCSTLSAPYEALYGDVLDETAKNEAFEDPEQVEIKAEQQGDG
jgi:hypothetical protein